MNILLAYRFYPLSIEDMAPIIFYRNLILGYLTMTSTNYKAPELID